MHERHGCVVPLLRLAGTSALGLLICLGCTGAPVASEKGDSLDRIQAESGELALVSDMAVSAPMGRLLLARKGGTLCAFRFVSARRGHDKREPTSFSSGEESLFGEYEWALLEEPEKGRVKPVKSGKGEVSRKGSIGVGRLATRIGRPAVSCGEVKAVWAYPNRLTFVAETPTGAFQYDNQLSLAPTAWREFSEINLADPRLKWYRLDSKRVERKVPVGELP
jgi:hypothetical protein